MNNLIMRIFTYFIIWRISLFFVSYLAIFIIPVFGDMFPYADKVLIPTQLPNWIWGFGNFDGVHYIKIAEEGYKSQYTQAFFPLYPGLTSLLGYVLSYFLNYHLAFFVSGLLLSNIFFLLSLYFLYKLFRLDYNENISLKSIGLLIAFPTAFYFSAIYTESIFLFLTIASFLFIRKKNYLLSGIFIGLASATRIIGFLLIPSLVVEIYFSYRSGYFKGDTIKFIKALIGLIIAPFGLLIYMSYLNLYFGNPFYFITSQPAFGTQRSIDNIILLPQVFFRYIKIFFSVPINSWAFFTAFLEFSFTLSILIILIIFFRKIRFSYFLFSIFNFILPTLTGTLLSMPRFVLLSFFVLPLLIGKLGKHYIKLVIVFILVQVVLFTLFIRGYWIA